jgi:hypothetical protein
VVTSAVSATAGRRRCRSPTPDHQRPITNADHQR